MHRGKLLPDITIGTDASIISPQVRQSGGGQLPIRSSPGLMHARLWEVPQDFLVMRVGAAEEDVAVPGDGGSEPEMVARPTLGQGSVHYRRAVSKIV